MSTRHTPEPWASSGCVNECSISGHSVICDQGRTPIGYIAYSDDANRAIICVNACAGIEDPAEAIREAREALSFIAELIGPNGERLFEGGCASIAQQALAKLQPKGAA